MNDDELSDRLRHLVERAQPVDLDEVIRRRSGAGRRRLLVVALAGVAVLALVAGAVALLRIDRDDAPPISTDPPATTVPSGPPRTGGWRSTPTATSTSSGLARTPAGSRSPDRIRPTRRARRGRRTERGCCSAG